MQAYVFVALQTFAIFCCRFGDEITDVCFALQRGIELMLRLFLGDLMTLFAEERLI
jgi:hypothetical protein